MTASAALVDKSSGMPNLEGRIAHNERVAEERRKLREMSSQIRSEIEGRQSACARSREWSLLSFDLRMCVVLVAGLDGDLAPMAGREWSEFSPAERLSLQIAVRSMYAGMSGAAALRLRVG